MLKLFAHAVFAARLPTHVYHHGASPRTVFSIVAPYGGKFNAELRSSSTTGAAAPPATFHIARVTINGRSSSSSSSSLSTTTNGSHTLTLRRGLNTVAYHSLGSLSLTVEGATNDADVRGGFLPFTTIEAEHANNCHGTVIGPSYESYSDTPHLATEASGRRACSLSSKSNNVSAVRVSDYVEFISVSEFSGIAIRYSLPDAPSGGGLEAPLAVAINGKPLVGSPTGTVTLTSAYSWYYGASYPFSNNPSDGKPHHFYDEVRVHVGNVMPVGTTVRLTFATTTSSSAAAAALVPMCGGPASHRKDCGFNGVNKSSCEARQGPAGKPCCYEENPPAPNPHHYPWCFFQTSDPPTPPGPGPTPPGPTPPEPIEITAVVIDLVDFYEIPAPFTPPSGAVSVMDHGADPSGATDSSAAFLAAIAAADPKRKQNATTVNGYVWLPEGNFTVGSIVHIPDHVTIFGAGPWYTFVCGTGQKVGQGAVGFYATQNGPSGSSRIGLHDFAIIGDVRERCNSCQVNGVGGAPTGGSTISNLYIQHTKCGLWLDGPGSDLCYFILFYSMTEYLTNLII